MSLEQRSSPKTGPKRGPHSRPTGRKHTEKNHRPTVAVDQPDELGILHGQNGEQGNTINPRNVQHEGDVAH
ncbi:MAG: hypothetical protein JWR19_2450 [Pedosphaera sp.]|nr:hypothetical protein [Pedosphaera sp.]